MERVIRKYKSWKAAEQETSVSYWKNKSDEERLEAMGVLAEQIFLVKPELQNYARPFPSIYPITKRRGS